MFNFDYITKENTKEDRYTILIVGSSGSGKSNAFFVLIDHQPDIDNIFLYAKDLYEAKCLLITN